MKIGLVIDDHMHRPGGVQEYVRGLYRYLQKQGHEPVIFAGGQHRQEELAERVISLGWSLPTKGSGSTSSLPILLKSNAHIRRMLAAENCDILHVQSPHSPTMSGRLLAQSNAAHVSSFQIRIDDGWQLEALSKLAPFQGLLYRHVHRRIAISQAALKTAQRMFPGDYTIIGVGVNIKRFQAAATLPRLSQYADGKITMFTVGRLEARKGVDHLLRAFALIERDHGDAVRLVIAGDGPQRDNLHALADQLQLKNVEWLGYVDNASLPHVMASADIFCAPATGQESFGYILIEAMAAGLPIVAFGNAGYAGVLAQHPGNLVVPVGDDRALAGGLATFVASAALRHHVSTMNKRDVEKHSWESVGAQIINVYQEAIALRRYNQTIL